MAGYNGKDSVATQWANMVADAARGEVVGIVDKHGNDVAVMISLEMFTQMSWEILVQQHAGGIKPRPDHYRVGMTWHDVSEGTGWIEVDGEE